MSLKTKILNIVDFISGFPSPSRGAEYFEHKRKMEKGEIKEALKEALPEVLNKLAKTGRIKISAR